MAGDVMGKFISDAEMEKLELSGKKNFISDEQLAAIEQKKPFGLGEAVRNFTQGGTFGFSDEISGGFEAGGRALGVKGLGGPIADISKNEKGLTLSLSELVDSYKAGRDLERRNLKEDAKNSPNLSLAVQLAGGVMSPVNKISALRNLSAAKGGAALGGLQGLGTSEAESFGGMAVDTALGAGLGAGAGKLVQKASSGIGSVVGKFADSVSPAKPKANAEEIIKAAREIGIPVTPGMLDDSVFIERLESTLSKSPSLFGQSVARKLRGAYEGLSQAGEDLTGGATRLSPFDLGEKFKSGISAKVAERLDPISSVFDDVASQTKHIPIGERSIKAIGRNIEADDLYSLGVGSETAKKYVNAIPNLKNANQVKVLMTALNEDLRSASGSDRQVLGMIKDKLARLESNSIVRGAIQAAKETGSGPGSMKAATGEKIGKDIVGDLFDARSAYKGLAQDIGAVAKEARIKAKSPNNFLSAVEDIPSERMQSKFFNVENNRQLIGLREKFPEQFELLKSGKMRDILKDSIDNSQMGQGKFASKKFLDAVRELNPEAQQMLFGSEGLNKISQMNTLQRALPRNFNPSGTSSELGWQDAIFKNVKDAPTYMLYRGASTNLGKTISNNLSKALVETPEMLNFSKKSPLAFQSFIQRLQGEMVEAQKGIAKKEESPMSRRMSELQKDK